MIYPTSRAIWLAAAGAPAALVLGVLVPGYWYVGIGWTLFVFALVAIDAVTGAWPNEPQAMIAIANSCGVGHELPATIGLRFPGAAPRHAEAILELPELLTAPSGARAGIAIAAGQGGATLPLVAARRGVAKLGGLWLRWTGPMGLAWKQRCDPQDARVIVTPDIRPVRERGAHLFLRSAMHGLIAQLDRGDGAEFESLADFEPGMDRRAIDWKQSARHARLLAKEFRTERNNHVVFALDAGRTMCEPLDGVPRIDRAISAALLSAYVALKLGDRVSLFGFDARPRIASGSVSGARAFGLIQRLAAELDYSTEETNYTLALTTLGGRLNRRSLIVVFTEFSDPTSAELMLRAATRLLDRHLVLFVVLDDQELTDIAAAPPESADDVSRAVTAAELLRERRIVVTRLRHAGFHVLESPHNRVGLKLVAFYIDLKRRNLL
ncbi:Uncharacterized conserved protein, DUF58 family, contains vWF domain [Sphingomonas laterariae]|uniref:Uncharacterized conserved protein, DUF58 family, contains vWF domain n=1 Tax=Edaphosphingomonas laterariae TaxID=861865 RepID=A0A239IFV6_9SPHN|nr:DUF58 domain-containing protein [Sphingomonas laterariae]SNS92540.1 Uncharacterized conserved protein, DUF58 family, contains vWF domain [Sphingomonas laterariae]